MNKCSIIILPTGRQEGYKMDQPMTYMSNQDIIQIAEGVVDGYYSGSPPPCIDVDKIATNYLGLNVLYEKFAENDLDKLGFTADGESPLRVRREGRTVPCIYPKDTIILDCCLLLPEMETKRRFTLAHEIAHVLLSRTDPAHHAACFHCEFDSERSYSVEDLKLRFGLGESQASSMGAFILMPRSSLMKNIQHWFHANKIPVYGNRLFLPETKLILQKLASQMVVSNTALVIQLDKCNYLEQRKMEEYFRLAGIIRGN